MTSDVAGGAGRSGPALPAPPALPASGLGKRYGRGWGPRAGRAPRAAAQRPG
jgi:hypothetical protein